METNPLLNIFGSGVINSGFSILVSSVLLVLSLLLLAFSAFFSGTEVAYFSLDDKTLNELEESEEESDKAVLKLLNSPQKLLATILICKSFANVAVVILLAAFSVATFDLSALPVASFLLQLAIIGFLVLVFGEIMPKVYSSEYPKIMAQRSSRLLISLQKLLKPFVDLMVNSTWLVKNRITKNTFNTISMDELSHALEYNASNTPDDEKDILEGIIKFGNIQVADIMTSRVDMVDVDIKSNFEQLLGIIIKSGYSRLPVYAGTRDNIKGILFSKDLLPHLDKPASFRWQTLIRQPYYVPETKKIDDLLSEFQENRVHLALVVDEYGGTSGLVTLEDILEEIVGDISDEYDDEEALFTKIDNHTFLFEAKILLNDFYKIAEISKDDFIKVTEDVETLAGLILELKGEMPVKGEQIGYGRYVFEVTAVDNRRIKKVKLYIKNDPRKMDDDD